MNLFPPFVRTRSSLNAKAILLACLFLFFGMASNTVAQSYDVTVYVDPNGNDGNSGTSGSPLRTVQFAATLAYQNKNNDLSTRVLIRPGTYRENVDLTTWTNWVTNDANNAELMTFEGTDANNLPVISGAELYTNWTPAGNLYTHSWTENWGVYDAPWTDPLANPDDIVLRREAVYVNDNRLDQVLSQGELVAGTYFIDEPNDLVYVYPPSGVNLPAAQVELAIRKVAWDCQYEYNVTVKNLRFEKTTDEWDNARGAFRAVDCDGLTLENVEFRYANWTGVYIGQSEDVTISNMKANDNGGRGFATWRIDGLLIQNSESLRNNWRGYLGGFTGWTVGNNVESSHNVQLLNHNASDNFSRGLWFDTDVVDAVIDNATINDNLNDGFFLEAVQGPITLKNSEIKRNLRNGLFSGMAEKVTLRNNIFEDNGQAAIVISGDNNGRGINIFTLPQGQNYYTVLTRWWTVEFNEFVGIGPYLIGTTVNNTRWSEFIGNLTANYNLWCDDSKTNVFRRDGGQLLTIAGWRTHTGEEANSQFCGTVLPVELASFDALVDGDDVLLQWQTLSETNNAGFEIERETIAGFERVGFTEGSGTTATATDYSFRVSEVPAGTHRFRLKQLDVDGSFEYSPIAETVVRLVEEFLLSDVYPNPVVTEARLSLTVRDEQNVTVELFDLLGKRVRMLHSGTITGGSAKELTLSTADLADGLYLVRVAGENFRQTRKVVVSH